MKVGKPADVELYILMKGTWKFTIFVFEFSF